MPAANSPSRNDRVTITCPCCDRNFTPTGRRLFCSLLLGSRKNGLVDPNALCAGRSSLCASNALSYSQTPWHRPKAALKGVWPTRQSMTSTTARMGQIL